MRVAWRRATPDTEAVMRNRFVPAPCPNSVPVSMVGDNTNGEIQHALLLLDTVWSARCSLRDVDRALAWPRVGGPT